MDFSQKNGYILAEMPKTLSVYGLDAIKANFCSIINENGKDLVLDMGEISSLNSPMVGLLTYLYKEITPRKRQLFLVNVSECLESFLRSVRIDEFIPAFYRSIVDFELDKEWQSALNLVSQ